MRLHVIGSGCPAPAPEWYGSSFILEVAGESVMVDCGPATTYKMTRMGIAPGRVGDLFLTHHHFDHNVDFPCFALTHWDLSSGTGEPLRVYGPPPTRDFADRLFGEDGIFHSEWVSRVEHPVSQAVHQQRGGILPRPPLRLDVRDLTPDDRVQGKEWSATCARVHHLEPWLESLVYRFETEEGSVLFAGDCADCAELRRMAEGVDTLVIAAPLIGRSPVNDLICEVITGTAQAAEIANTAKVGRVILTHVTPGFDETRVAAAIADVAANFAGEVLLPSELSTVEL